MKAEADQGGPGHGQSACKYPVPSPALECGPSCSAVIQPCSAVSRPLRGSDVSSGLWERWPGSEAVRWDLGSLVATPRCFPNFWSRVRSLAVAGAEKARGILPGPGYCVVTQPGRDSHWSNERRTPRSQVRLNCSPEYTWSELYNCI